ncbi:hypothetical protein [Sandaracinus amylolyticus]|uniref:Tryptophan synthase alpha chain n=1 Tax=Sandaracinus amylolyticus TaxID=927083 RepID=A0A0F6W279_9BACT|nr:hypothetical protein [Sandaracinus amylolyticus]AKF05612.1 Tryptophan synthase alpha chain [Sandaracinus amylolyticus]
MRSWSWMLAACAALAGCESSVPSFPPVTRDAGYECGDADGGSVACPSGEVCLQGFCYAQCSETRPCGPLEMCSAQGVCVASTTDAGPPVDGGPPDPCETTTCSDPTPFCRAGSCLACLEATGICPAPAPVCDLARGSCVAFDGGGGAICTACNMDADCTSVDPSLRCLTRSFPEPTERVCVPSCEGGAACPAGLECDAETLRCVPRFNYSCTGFRASLAARACASDAECAPVGASAADGLFTGSCSEDGVRPGLTCHVPCGVDADCPAGTCMTGFCR